MNESEALADIETYRDDIGLQRPPIFRRRCVKELESVALFSQLDLEDEGLIDVPQERDRVRVLPGA